MYIVFSDIQNLSLPELNRHAVCSLNVACTCPPQRLKTQKSLLVETRATASRAVCGGWE